MKRFFVPLMLLWVTPALALAPPAAGEVEVIESYDAGLGQLPEGVAVSPRGDIYVTLAGTGELRKIDRQTKVGVTLAQFDIGFGFLLGMAFDGEVLYVVLGSFVDDTCGVWRVDEHGSSERVVAFPGTAFPNDLTFDSAGNMFVTESIGGAVYRVTAEELAADSGAPITPTLWIQDPLLVGDVEVSPVPFPIGANGIVYDDERGVVLVANSQNPAVVEIDDNGGQAGVLSVIASGEDLRGADGLALGKRGEVYVGANFNSTVVCIGRDDGSREILADADDGLVFPSTLAFGQWGPDKHALFIANFGFGAGPNAPVGVLRLEVEDKSEKHPAGT
jgi:sugar lactone lactonase YvrE